MSMNTRNKSFPHVVQGLPKASQCAVVGTNGAGKELSLKEVASSKDPLALMRKLAKSQRVSFEYNWPAHHMAHALLVANGVSPARTGIKPRRTLTDRLGLNGARAAAKRRAKSVEQTAADYNAYTAAVLAARREGREDEVQEQALSKWKRMMGPRATGAQAAYSPVNSDEGDDDNEQEPASDGDGVASGAASEGEFVPVLEAAKPTKRRRVAQQPQEDLAAQLQAHRIEAAQRERRLAQAMETLAGTVAKLAQGQAAQSPKATARERRPAAAAYRDEASEDNNSDEDSDSELENSEEDEPAAAAPTKKQHQVFEG
jgi:hypothetical protein